MQLTWQNYKEKLIISSLLEGISPVVKKYE